MSVEKFIHGKVDNGKHEGKRSELLRIQEADACLQDFLKDASLEERQIRPPVTGKIAGPNPAGGAINKYKLDA